MTTQITGRLGEEMAAEFLQKQGLQLLLKNYKYNHGEIDLIMQDKEMLVFVEVRTRHNPHYASAFESVDENKQRKLIRTAYHYLQHHNLCDKVPCRFDVIAIKKDPAQPIEWLKDAFAER